MQIRGSKEDAKKYAFTRLIKTSDPKTGGCSFSWPQQLEARDVLLFNTIEQTAEKQNSIWAHIGNETWCSCQEKTVFLSSKVFLSTVVTQVVNDIKHKQGGQVTRVNVRRTVRKWKKTGSNNSDTRHTRTAPTGHRHHITENVTVCGVERPSFWTSSVSSPLCPKSRPTRLMFDASYRFVSSIVCC